MSNEEIKKLYREIAIKCTAAAILLPGVRTDEAVDLGIRSARKLTAKLLLDEKTIAAKIRQEAKD